MRKIFRKYDMNENYLRCLLQVVQNGVSFLQAVLLTRKGESRLAQKQKMWVDY